jgi:hypothetical protein
MIMVIRYVKTGDHGRPVCEGVIAVAGLVGRDHSKASAAAAGAPRPARLPRERSRSPLLTKLRDKPDISGVIMVAA